MSKRDLCVWSVLSILFFPFLISEAAADSANSAQPQVRGWTEDLDLLATDREKNLFSGLHGDSERQLFLQQFWQARDPYPQTSRNELREEWERRLLEVHRRWNSLSDARSRVYLLRGEPTTQFEAQCPASGNFEIWTYEPGFQEKYRTVLIFPLSPDGLARLWRPGTPPDLNAVATEACSNREKLSQETKWIRWTGREQYAALIERSLSLPLPRAYLAGGGSSEDVVFINTPAEPDRLDVNLVELFASVRDGQGRPVTSGLEPGSFVVLEDGVRQQLREVAPVGDTPVRVVTLIDSSASMAPEMAPTRQAALDFLHGLLRPHDQAAVITFNRAPQVKVALTSDLGQLEEGLQGILAEDDTALYDSLVYSLLYLTSTSGQRAVLLLSDGQDRTSHLGFEQALEVAHRTGIAVYAIGLNLQDGPKGEAAQKLNRLATVTGGRSFFAKDVSALAGVYKEVEKELRSQYRIAYQSSKTTADGAFRNVKVQMAQGGMEARTISGYYP